jgi:hypothetical protein
MGGALGLCHGMYEGYMLSKRRDYVECVTVTLLTGGVGGYMGAMTTMLLPLVFPVAGAIALLRYLDNQPGIPPFPSSCNYGEYKWLFH